MARGTMLDEDLAYRLLTKISVQEFGQELEE